MRRPDPQGLPASPLPLKSEGIEAARQLYEKHLPQWRAADAALAQLRGALPGYSLETNLIKVATVNTLYGTNLRATHRMAAHIADVTDTRGSGEDPATLVNRIAAMPLKPGEPLRTHRSFASKFCHFFVNADRFPILDGAACDALKLHLGPARCKGIDTSYGAFLAALDELRDQCSPSLSNRDLDRYLWILGMHLRYRRGDREINRDLLSLFEASPMPSELATIAAITAS